MSRKSRAVVRRRADVACLASCQHYPKFEDGSSVHGVVDANPPLLEVTGAFALRVVVVLDLRIKNMFVTHIAEASGNGDGKSLVDNGGVNGCW